MGKYRPIYWSSPTRYVGDNGTHFKDFAVKATPGTRFMAALHRLLGKRDPFFFRQDYL